MKRIHFINSLIIAAFLICGSAASLAGIPVPEIPQGKGEACVKPTDDMRMNHMKYIQHKRDETMHKGIRTDVRSGSYSFKDCMNCHAVLGADNQPVNYKDEKHFCNSCHTYAAVNIDCFQCHVSTPAKEKSADSSHSLMNKIINSMKSGSVE